MAVEYFRDEYEFLSNFFASPIKYKGVTYATVEHAFQAAKANTPEQAAAIGGAKTPGRAKAIGRQVLDLRPTWDDEKLAIMAELLEIKFSDPELRNLLLATKGDLTEGNEWHDTFWGAEKTADGTWVGENALGKLLMALRAKLAKEDRASGGTGTGTPAPVVDPFAPAALPAPRKTTRRRK